MPARSCSPDSTSSRSASRRAPASTRCRPCSVRITPRPTRSSSGTPVCRSSRLTCWETALGVKPRASAAPTTEPWVSTARRLVRAARSIMKRCYMDPCMNSRWCYMVAVRLAGRCEPPRLAPRRPGGHDLGLQLRRHRLGDGRSAAAAVRGDPLHAAWSSRRSSSCPAGGAVAGDRGGRGLHVAGAVRLPLRRDGRRDAARARRAGAPGAGDLHGPDRGGRAARDPDPGPGRRGRPRRGRPGGRRRRPRRPGDRCWPWRCACSARCRGASAT